LLPGSRDVSRLAADDGVARRFARAREHGRQARRDPAQPLTPQRHKADHMTPSRRSLCIVSRDPVQCSELVLSLQTLLDPGEEVEIVMDRRRERAVFDSEPPSGRPAIDRRANPDVDLAVRTKGFAIVPATPRATRGPDAPDADERARFENILSFK